MSDTTYDYPFDPTGTRSTNRILGERHLITPPNWRDFFVVIPKAAPFFRESLQVRHLPSGRILDEGVDYYVTHMFKDATLSTAKPIYGSITVLDKTMAGALEIDYNTVGGRWTLTSVQITEILAGRLADPRITTWEQIVELPVYFPAIDHDFDVVDFTGMSDVCDKLNEIEDAILAAGNQGEGVVTAETLGLSAFVNKTFANATQAMDDHNADTVISPAMLHLVMNSTVGQELLTHVNAQGNVHNLTPAHLNLEKVANYPMATAQQAVDGATELAYINPVTLAAALQAFYDRYLVPHLLQEGNVHNLKKSDLALEKVPNWNPASIQSALLGQATNEFVSPDLMRRAVAAWIGDTLASHIDEPNAHNVSKGTLGLSEVVNLGLATVEQARAANSDSGLLTPRLGYELFVTLFDQFIANGGNGGGTSNPDETYTKQEIDFKLNQRLGKLDSAENALKLEGLSVNQIVDRTKIRRNWPAIANTSYTWTKVAVFTPSTSNPDAQVGDLTVYLTGGDRPTDNNVPVYLLKLNMFSTLSLTIEQISGRATNTKFGYVTDQHNNEVSIWMRCPPDRNPISTLVLSDPFESQVFSDIVQTNRPTGLIDAEYSIYNVSLSETSRNPGDLNYGMNPFKDNRPQFGKLLEHINVVTTTAEVSSARTHLGSIQKEYRDWLRLSSKGLDSRFAVKADLTGWGFADVDHIQYLNKSTSLATLLTEVEYQDYQVDVEFHADNNESGAIGICISHIQVNGRDYGLYLLRHPNDHAKYGLLSIVLNPYQNDEVIVEVVRTELKAAATWSTLNQNQRMRVTRGANSVIVQYLPDGETDFNEAKSLIVPFAGNEELNRFIANVGVWGLACYGQPDAFFKIYNRPDYWKPYISYSRSNSGADTSTLSRFNGLAWVSEAMAIQAPHGLPGRLIYSDLNQKLYQTRRDGSIDTLDIVPVLPEGATIVML